MTRNVLSWLSRPLFLFSSIYVSLVLGTFSISLWSPLASIGEQENIICRWYFTCYLKLYVDRLLLTTSFFKYSGSRYLRVLFQDSNFTYYCKKLFITPILISLHFERERCNTFSFGVKTTTKSNRFHLQYEMILHRM